MWLNCLDLSENKRIRHEKMRNWEIEAEENMRWDQERWEGNKWNEKDVWGERL